MVLEENNETIAAPATPVGRSSVGIIRVSGPKSLAMAKQLLKKNSIRARYAYYLPFYNSSDEPLDQGIALFFKSPHSFTGEDVLELHAHGGPIVLDRLLKAILSFGARLAKPGEFSERAFLNNKIDLLQAESIADLINASSEQAARGALRSLQGGFSRRIDHLNKALTDLRVYIEAAIDFSEEEIDFLKDSSVELKLKNLLAELDAITQTAKQGTLLREGMNVVIVGKPNVGKSSLLNALSGKDSAIVTDIAGTTRDVLREHIHLDGMPLHIIDTAGLQSTSDRIEQEGIRRTWKEIEKADKILLMVDSAQPNESDPALIDPDFFSKIKPAQSVSIIKNKIDLTLEKPHIEKKGRHDTVFISAKKQLGLDLLKAHLKTFMGFQPETEGIFLARRRHLDALHRTQNCLISASRQLSPPVSVELLAEDLRQAQQALSEITGEFTSDDLLTEIFSSFCIGK